jgi:hypothetical protein
MDLSSLEFLGKASGLGGIAVGVVVPAAPCGMSSEVLTRTVFRVS